MKKITLYVENSAGVTQSSEGVHFVTTRFGRNVATIVPGSYLPKWLPTEHHPTKGATQCN